MTQVRRWTILTLLDDRLRGNAWPQAQFMKERGGKVFTESPSFHKYRDDLRSGC